MDGAFLVSAKSSLVKDIYLLESSLVSPQRWMCTESPSLDRDQVQCLHWHTKPGRIDPDLQNVMSSANLPTARFSHKRNEKGESKLCGYNSISGAAARDYYGWLVHPGFLCLPPRARSGGRRRCSRLCCSLGGWESQAQQGHGWQQWGRDRDVLARDQWSIRHHMSLQTLKAKDSAKLNALITIWWGNSQDTLFGERAGPSEGDISKICSGQS